MSITEHPTVRAWRAAQPPVTASTPVPLDAAELRRLCLDAGADDVGFVSIDRPELDDQRDDILRVVPGARTLISLVCRMNREPIRSPARSVANLEFHHSGESVNEIARHIVGVLEGRGVRALNPSMGFPMEMERFPGKIWVVSHKPVAVAAGLGRMGIHRNVIHPRFGNFILLGTVVVDAEVTTEDQPIEYNPCLECKLCVAACPVGAIGADGSFNFTSCYTHNYREFMGGFTDWVEQVADSSNARDYRQRVNDSESASMWQSLSYGANYKAAYCLAVCPAGEDVIGPFLTDRSAHVATTVKPLQARKESVYVVRNSDAEEHAARRFPHKEIRHVGNSLRPRSVFAFLQALPHVFQRSGAGNLEATYHFVFTGEEECEALVRIGEGKCEVQMVGGSDVRGEVPNGVTGIVGSAPPGQFDARQADLRIRADSRTWLGFLSGDRSLVWALLRRRIRLSGSPRWLVAFGKCFPR